MFDQEQTLESLVDQVPREKLVEILRASFNLEQETSVIKKLQEAIQETKISKASAAPVPTIYPECAFYEESNVLVLTFKDINTFRKTQYLLNVITKNSAQPGSPMRAGSDASDVFLDEPEPCQFTHTSAGKSIVIECAANYPNGIKQCARILKANVLILKDDADTILNLPDTTTAASNSKATSMHDCVATADPKPLLPQTMSLDR